MALVEGNLLETETDIPVNKLPAAVLSYLKEQYKGTPVKEAAKIIKADGTVNYEAEINKKDIILDTNGKFIKKTND